MPFLPVAAREVREASRQPRTYRWRWVTAAAALGLMAFVWWVTRHSFSQGHDLFVAISTAAYIYCLMAGAIRTADTIAEEKRDNTLGLLFLTDLKEWDIVFGKLLSSSANCFFGLLALFPMLAIPVLMGGVPLDQFGKIILNLLNTLFLSLSWGFLISSIFRHSVVTISSSLLVMAFLGGAIPLIGILIHEEFRLEKLAGLVWLFTPTQIHANAFGPPNPKEFNHYWTPLLVNHALAWAQLRAAIYFLPRLWQETPKNKTTEKWREKIRAWRFGKGKAKVRFRTRLLNQNPLFWLANREQVSSMGLMIVTSLVLGSAMLIGVANSRGWRRMEEMMISWIVGVVIVHVMIAFRMAMAASNRLAEDRRSGALELLLGTELSIRDLLRGHWMALGRQFFGPMLIVSLAAVFAFAFVLAEIGSGFGSTGLLDTLFELMARLWRTGVRAEESVAFLMGASVQLMLMLNWIALIWVGMWLGLREKRSGFSTWTTLAMVLFPPWILMIIGFASMEEAGAFRGMRDEVVMTMALVSGWILGLGHVLFLSYWARGNLLERFREVAADRYAGPRRFPWPAIGRVTLRFAGAGAAICLLFVGFRAVVNGRGEKAWQKALAAHPTFAASYGKEAPEAAMIPAAENLARIALFDALGRGQGRNRKQMNWNMGQLAPPGPGGNEQLSWDWGQAQKLNVGRVAEIYGNLKVIGTNVTDPAREVRDALLKVYGADLESLRVEAARRPRAQFPYRAYTPAQNLPIQLQPYVALPARNVQFISDPSLLARPVIDTLVVLAGARLAANEDPLEDIFIGLRLAEGLSHAPPMLLTYHETLLGMTQPIYDGLAARRWKNEQLKRIQDYYAGLDLWTRYELYREVWVAQTLVETERIVQARQGTIRGREKWLARQIPHGFLRQGQASFLNWGLDETPRAVDLKARRIDLELAKQIQEKRPDGASRFGRPQGPYLTSLRSLAFMQTTADQIILACALERFRNDHRKLPGTLEELVPQYIAAIPRDVLGGQALGYKVKNGEYYLLYSVGVDGQDNGGTAAPVTGSWSFWQDSRTGDWVWDSEAKDAPPPQKRTRRR